MREIKFRGKRVDNGEWVYGYGAVVGEHYGSIHDEEREASIFVEYDKVSKLNFQLVNVDPETVGQYTGMKDKNGTEIYEWDIIAEDYFSNVNPNDLSDDNYIDDEPKKLIICYDSNQGRYKAVPTATYIINAGNGGWTGYDVRGYKSEVVGNIHE